LRSRKAFLFGCLSVGTLLLLLAGCSAQRVETEVQDRALTLYLRGYVETCTDDRLIHVRENGTWRRASFEPPGMDGEPHYLHGEFHDMDKGCDLSMCQQVDRVVVDLVEYEQIGEKDVPETSRSWRYGTLRVPEYRTVPLSGEIKVEYTYHTDKNCRRSKQYTTTIRQ
jgi:hypothetical protein